MFCSNSGDCMWRMAVVACGIPSLVLAAAPAHVPVQARLLDSTGVPIELPVDVTFALYTQASGGSAVYSETRAIDPQNGYFSVFIGEVTPLDWTIVDGSLPLFVGFSVNGATELSRQPVGTVPFAAYADRAGQAATAEDADSVQGFTVSDIVNEVESTYPNLSSPYVDSDAVAAVVGAYPSIGDHYSDSDAVAAMGSLGPSNALNHARYSDDEARAAMGSLSDSNPRHHARYSDSEARSTIAGEDRYLLDTTDTLTGVLTVTDDLVVNDNILFRSTIRDDDSDQAVRLIKMSFVRGVPDSSSVTFTDADGLAHVINVSGAAVTTSHLAWRPGSGGGDGRLYFNIESSPSISCTLLHQEDDTPRPGYYFATDGGNDVAGIWGNATTSTFILARSGVSTAPMVSAAAFNIMCF